MAVSCSRRRTGGSGGRRVFFQGKSTRNPGLVSIQRGGVSYHPQFPSSNYGEHKLGIELGYANVLEDILFQLGNLR